MHEYVTFKENNCASALHSYPQLHSYGCTLMVAQLSTVAQLWTVAQLCTVKKLTIDALPNKNTVNSLILKDHFCQVDIFVFFVFGSFLGQSESSPDVS